MTHNVQLHVGASPIISRSRCRRENADRVGDVGRTVVACIGNRRHARRAETALENLVSWLDSDSNERNGSPVLADAVVSFHGISLFLS